MKEYVKFKLESPFPGIPSRPTCRSWSRIKTLSMDFAWQAEEQGWNPQEVESLFQK